MTLTPAAAYAKALAQLREGALPRLAGNEILLLITPPGAARKPIYAEIRALKKLIARVDGAAP